MQQRDYVPDAIDAAYIRTAAAPLHPVFAAIEAAAWAVDPHVPTLDRASGRVLAVLAAGCTGDKAPDDTSGGDDTSDTSTDSGDSGDTAACNTDNEACAPGVAGCGGEGANMLPGSDCLSCHRRGGADEAPEGSVGGTVFSDLLGTAGAAGVRVIVTDSTGTSVTLTGGSVGNFYTS